MFSPGKGFYFSWGCTIEKAPLKIIIQALEKAENKWFAGQPKSGPPIFSVQKRGFRNQESSGKHSWKMETYISFSFLYVCLTVGLTYHFTDLGLLRAPVIEHLRVTELPAWAWMSGPPSILTTGTAKKIGRRKLAFLHFQEIKRLNFTFMSKQKITTKSFVSLQNPFYNIFKKGRSFRVFRHESIRRPSLHKSK